MDRPAALSCAPLRERGPAALSPHDVLQLRALGEMPFIQNSFFLISARMENTPRVVFAMFQVPLAKKGHYFNVNSGGGSLSLELIRSVHKRMLSDPAFYVYNAFEQGNGAAVEFGGPIDKKGKYLYRTFLGGGSGRFAGNIGGTFFPDNNNNYTFSAGAQFWMNFVGYYNRWDTPFIYTPSPLAVGDVDAPLVAVGASSVVADGEVLELVWASEPRSGK